MFIRVLQNDPNWHTLDCLPGPYAIDRKKLATIGGRSRRRFNAGRPFFLSAIESCVATTLTAQRAKYLDQP
jgi:hypothetical protein